jgi:hypothetical protein|tara:strand:+ start:229 stop:543 length:315 start_codon:yes stop_codon:yes gene_type:complete
MGTYANNKSAYGICDISGFRYNLKDMKKTWNGLMVGPDMFDPKHPQLSPKPAPREQKALKNARLDVSDTNNFFVVYTNVGTGILGQQLVTFGLTMSVGEVTITT